MRRLIVKPIFGALVLIAASAAITTSAQEITSFSALSAQERSAFKPLSQEQAFPYFVSEAGNQRLQVSWQPAAEHYLYKRGFKFTFHSSQSEPGLTIPFSLPQGLAKNDEFFGAVEVYYVPVAVTLDLPQTPTEGGYIVIEYQGCADWGFCYPPQSDQFNF
ncbi:MAG: thiol:disulfide interchange protein DsbD [Pseudohongiellaceae bacterium]|jgi:thiol:disulfide interchange protein DsbD